MPLTITLRTPTTLPVEVFGVRTDLAKSLPLPEFERLPILVGRDTLPLAELFAVAGSAREDETLVWRGALECVKGIAAGMTSGNVVVEGSAGMHVAAEMRGGTVSVQGDAGDWAGAHLAGGRLTITGNAARCLGGAYRGCLKGMTGGEIHVHGNTGDEVGQLMRRGTIAICGSAGDGTGFGMLAGTILVAGALGRMAGAGMKRGSLITLHPDLPLLPSFRRSAIYDPTFVKLLATSLIAAGLPTFEPLRTTVFERYCGDFNEAGRGEILLPATSL